MNLVNAHIISSQMDDDQLIRETNIAKYRTFAKTCFQDSVKYEHNYIDYIRNISRHYACNLPEHIGEFFINSHIAPHFWITEAPVIANVELVLDDSQDGMTTVSSNYGDIKSFYSKWLNQKGEKEKQYFALSTINLIERNSNNNHILKKILYANIVIFDPRIYLPSKSLELLNECEQLASNLAVDEVTKRELLYLISLYAGIVLFKMESYQEAQQKFNSSLNYKSTGISAVYYLALTEKRLNNRQRSVELLGAVVEYDQIRFKYAFDANSLYLFKYFFQNSVTYNIFSELEFSDYLFDIELLLPYHNQENNRIFERLFDAKFVLGELYIEKYYNDEVKIRLEFLTKFMETFKQSKNLLLPFTYQFLKLKFNETLLLIDSLVKKHFDTIISVELKLYDEQFNRNQEEKIYRDEEANKVRDNYKRDMEDALRDNGAGYKTIIEHLEKRIERLGNDVKFDPRLSFNNSMVYNTIISTMVFIVGGFTDGMSDTNDSGFEMASNLFWCGIKWGGITFLLGIIISMVSSISAIWERSVKKQKLLKEIKLRKKQEDWMVDEIKKEQAGKIRLYDANHTKKISNLEDENEELTLDKNKKSNVLSTKYVSLIDGIEVNLKKLILD